MAQQNTNRDNADTDTWQSDDTPEKLQRNAHAKNQTTATLGATKSCHFRTSKYRKKRNKGTTAPPKHQEKDTDRTDPIHSSAPGNAWRDGTEPRRQEAAGRNRARIPHGKSSQELAQQEETPLGQKRKYTCHNCSRPFSSTIGKFDHIKQHPEFQNVRQQDTFGNKRNDCNRAYKEPGNLWEHQQFVCADLRKNRQRRHTKNKRKWRRRRKRSRNNRAEKFELYMRATKKTQGIRGGMRKEN